MLLPNQKPSSSYSLLKFIYVTSQLRNYLADVSPPKKNPGSAPFLLSLVIIWSIVLICLFLLALSMRTINKQT